MKTFHKIIDIGGSIALGAYMIIGFWYPILYGIFVGALFLFGLILEVLIRLGYAKRPSGHSLGDDW